jgi:hypothetical protein
MRGNNQQRADHSHHENPGNFPNTTHASLVILIGRGNIRRTWGRQG